MNFRLIAYLFVITAFTMSVQGQEYRYNTVNNELVYVHLEKLTYVAGETVHYKAYIADAEYPGKNPCSSILYFTLSGSHEPLTWRINLKGKSAAGSFLLPDYLKEGMYTLTAYTNWMRNGSPETYFSQKLLVVSLSEETAGYMRMLKPAEPPDLLTDSARGSSLRVKLNKSSYRPGETVEAEILLNGVAAGDADVSVSVASADPFENYLDQKHIATEMTVVRKAVKRTYNMQPDCAFPIEDKGFILSGRIILPKGTRAAEPCNVWLSVTDSLASALMFARADSTGEFRFYLGSRYDNKELIIQLADPAQNQDCRLEVFSKTVMGDTARTPYTMDSVQRTWLSGVEDVRMIEAVYGPKENSLASEEIRSQLSFLRKPDKVIFPAEYSEMRNFREIANNYVPQIRFNIRNEKMHLLVLNPANTWRESKVVLLNGVPFNDLGYVSTLGTKDIKRIEIYKPNMLVGDMTLPGLVCIYTYDMKIPENYLQSRTIRYMNTVLDVTETAAEQEVTADKNGHYPDFRNTLYWNPFVKLTGGSATVRFPSLLMQGQFVVRVEGMTVKGIPVSALSTFEIKE